MANRYNKIAVFGSLAYDYIMDFPDRFSNHILPNKIHELNVSFSINRLQSSFGGVAGNIAYTLSLLNAKPVVAGVMGTDAAKYLQWFKENNIDHSLVKIAQSNFSASAYIITDQKDNQISGFFPGPNVDYKYLLNKMNKIDLFIVSAETKPRMSMILKYLIAKKKDFIFDPGQQTFNFTKTELSKIIKKAKVVIGNDYEISTIAKKLGFSLSQLINKVSTLIITKGSKGSIIYNAGQVYKIKAVKVKKVLDPTGAGDAYRAGLLKGMMLNLDWQQIGNLASLVASYPVARIGTQKHKFDWTSLKKRYKVEFNKDLNT